MPFKMVELKRCKRTGSYFARKGIPSDVRDAHERLYGSRWETQFRVAGNLSLEDAKRHFYEWQSEVSSRIEALRREARGEGRELTHREAHALAGEWYAWFVGLHESEPGPIARWSDLALETLHTRLGLATPTADPRSTQEARAFVADFGLTSQFLLEKGIALSVEARGRFLDVVAPQLEMVALRLARYSEGDYSRDDWKARFPKALRAAGMTCWQLFEAWVAERKPKPSTVDRRRGVFLDLQRHFSDREIASITEQEAVAWKDRLLTPERSGRTVNDVWLATVKGVFKWAVTNKKIPINPFEGLRVTYAPPQQNRDSRAFTMPEANAILRASLAIPAPRLSAHYKAARRWVPWLAAYSGARVQEITQLRAEDVVEQEGVWAIRLMPGAGTMKTGKARTVPLHEHLIAQGFLDFVRRIGKGPMFYDARAQAAQRPSDPTNPQKCLAVKAREHLAKWVRKIGVDDPELSPNHSWRHLFKEIADRCDMREKVSDAITGHAPATVGRTYGRPTLQVMAAELAKFPRFA